MISDRAKRLIAELHHEAQLPILYAIAQKYLDEERLEAREPGGWKLAIIREGAKATGPCTCRCAELGCDKYAGNEEQADGSR